MTCTNCSIMHGDDFPIEHPDALRKHFRQHEGRARRAKNYDEADKWREKHEGLPQKLQQDYPTVYGNLRMGGFECSAGWIPILDRYGEKLSEFRNEVPERVVIVKEKFGALEIQGLAVPTEAHDLLSEARAESMETCEWCGREGEPRAVAVRATLCDMHYEERKDGR